MYSIILKVFFSNKDTLCLAVSGSEPGGWSGRETLRDRHQLQPEVRHRKSRLSAQEDCALFNLRPVTQSTSIGIFTLAAVEDLLIFLMLIQRFEFKIINRY